MLFFIDILRIRPSFGKQNDLSVFCVRLLSGAGDVEECGFRWQDGSRQAPPCLPLSPLFL